MQEISIKQLTELYRRNEFTSEMIEMLKNDTRKGVQKLLQSYYKDQEKIEKLKQQYQMMCQFENNLFTSGISYIAGVDEAGRGPLAGPVVAAAVILPKDFELLGLNDSKQLSEKMREQFFEQIKRQALSWHVSIIDHLEIDQINIFNATKKAMRNAIQSLHIAPEHVLIDAVELNELQVPTTSIIKGDAKSVSIAAASILAKVTRDHYMKKLDALYPEYGFSSHMGYGTKGHIEALQQYGPTPYHRTSFAPVKQIVEMKTKG